jgi:hypothetical protein
MPERHATRRTVRTILRAILTDVQFWIPALVLVFGVVLLVLLHASGH